MTKKLRVVHYINQFFAQLGGEDTASIGIQVFEKPMGPGIGIGQELGERGEIVATIVCGDNHIAEHLEAVTAEILEIIKTYKPDLFFAGPAFNAGRYGVACGSLCAAVKKELGIPAVTGMYQENPGVEIFKSDLFILKTGDNARKMKLDTRRMVDFASLPGAMSVSHRSMYFASVSCWTGCGVWRQSRSKRTACSLSHFSTCLGVSSSGGWTVFCRGLMRLPL